MAIMAHIPMATMAHIVSVCLLFLHVRQVHTSPGTGIFALYYKTRWSPGYLHYNPDDQGWNGIPGMPMTPSTNTTYPSSQWRYVEVVANSIVWTLTDGNGNWDSNNGQNYYADTPGIYTLQNGQASVVQTFDKGCPGTPQCGGHGKCNPNTFKCECDPTYYGGDCSKVCKDCGKHGKCDSNGNCVCQDGWATCSSRSLCSTNVGSDRDNCGGCGSVCRPGGFVESASCSTGMCHRTCKGGYQLCPDSTCQLRCNLPGCDIYSENQCSGDNVDTDPKYEVSRWQTPNPGEDFYRPSYQSYGQIQGHARLVYTEEHTSVTVNLIAVTKTNTSVSCMFDGKWGNECSKTFSINTPGPISVAMKTAEGSSIQLDDVDFMWGAPFNPPEGGDYRKGQKGAIVEFFGWPHADIEQECEFLAQAGYAGAKVFPPQEQLMSTSPYDNVLNPWYFMYQPVSYRLQGRMGSRDQLRSMIHTCKAKGVRVYADAVVNHMVGNGNDGSPSHRNPSAGCAYWGPKNTSADYPPTDKKQGSSPFFTQGFQYQANIQTGQAPAQEFPTVPYGPTDFHCERVLSSWSDPLTLNAGWLTGLTDLNTEKESVQQRIADYLTDLVSIGFSGVRIDAAKHMKPEDLGGIFGKLKTNLGGQLPDDFIAWLEVLLGGEADLLLGDPSSGYSYSVGLEKALQANGLDKDDVDKIKIWFSGYPKEPNVDQGHLSRWRKAIQNDDADQQNSGSTSRDMGDQGSVLIVDHNVEAHRNFEVKLFANPNGATDNTNDYPIRLVLSSYYADLGSSYGIPDGWSDCATCVSGCGSCSKSMTKTPAYSKGATAYTGPTYTYVHRDPSIVKAMRQWIGLGSVNHTIFTMY